MSGAGFAIMAYVVGLGLFAGYSIRLWWMMRCSRAPHSGTEPSRK